jgi:hypothetical protein
MPPQGGQATAVAAATAGHSIICRVSAGPCAENRQLEADPALAVRTKRASQGLHGQRRRQRPARAEKPIAHSQTSALAKSGSERVEGPDARNADLRSSSRSASEHLSKILNLFGNLLGNGVTVAQQTLTLFVLVRIQVPQPPHKPLKYLDFMENGRDQRPVFVSRSCCNRLQAISMSYQGVRRLHATWPQHIQRDVGEKRKRTFARIRRGLMVAWKLSGGGDAACDLKNTAPRDTTRPRGLGSRASLGKMDQ